MRSFGKEPARYMCQGVEWPAARGARISQPRLASHFAELVYLYYTPSAQGHFSREKRQQLGIGARFQRRQLASAGGGSRSTPCRWRRGLRRPRGGAANGRLAVHASHTSPSCCTPSAQRQIARVRRHRLGTGARSPRACDSPGTGSSKGGLVGIGSGPMQI
jgi:hypothetical protein